MPARSRSPNPGSMRKRSMQVYASHLPPFSTSPSDQALYISGTTGTSPLSSPPLSPPPSPFSPPPSADGIKKKRRSMWSKMTSTPSPASEVKKGEVSGPVMEISGPELKQHTWKGRKSENRTAKRGKDRFRSKSKQTVVPEPSYYSYEVSYICIICIDYRNL